MSVSSLSIFNSSNLVTSGLFNLSTFSSYKPGFSTITSSSTEIPVLDITNIETSSAGFNILLVPSAPNISIPLVGGIDNSGNTLKIGPYTRTITIGNLSSTTNLSGKNYTTNINVQRIYKISDGNPSALVYLPQNQNFLFFYYNKYWYHND